MPRAVTHNPIYNDVLLVATDYLGPAASRFVDRSIRNHLHKSPHELEINDLETLIHWLQVSVSVLTEDSELIDSFVQRLEAIQQKSTES